MKLKYILSAAALCLLTSCSDFLDVKPKGVITNEEINNPQLLDNMVLSAYAIWVTGDDINSSFSLVNFDLRSDDCYKGGKGPEDGNVFHSLEVCYGISTEDWNINGMWERIYKNITRANSALKSLSGVSDDVPTKKQRTAEMKFLRAHAHFLLKQLFKKIVIINNENLTDEEYNNLSNFTYTNDEQWQKIIEDFQYAYDNLPVTQNEVGRPSKAAAAAYLAKAYLYKAYRQDDENSNRVTEINTSDLQQVIKYTDRQIYEEAGFDLEDDFAYNFLPDMENGKESLWAYQYSMNDGTLSGQLNFGKGLSAPWFKINAHDFHKPSQNLINAYRTDANGLPMFNDFNKQNFDAKTDNVDPRLFHTASLPGSPFKYNPNYIVQATTDWSRSDGQYGYCNSLKECVDFDSEYLQVYDNIWATPMNHIVLRYADVLLMRAEATIQTGGNISEAMALINSIRNRASASVTFIKDYKRLYGARMKCSPYTGQYNHQQAIQILKWERRLEFACEGSRFFDLVRWGDAEKVINTYFVEEKAVGSLYDNAHFNANKNEYLPIPNQRIMEAAGKYKQNVGWGEIKN